VAIPAGCTDGDRQRFAGRAPENAGCWLSAVIDRSRADWAAEAMTSVTATISGTFSNHRY
jgi:hypothetical protein